MDGFDLELVGIELMMWLYRVHHCGGVEMLFASLIEIAIVTGTVNWSTQETVVWVCIPALYLCLGRVCVHDHGPGLYLHLDLGCAHVSCCSARAQ